MRKAKARRRTFVAREDLLERLSGVAQDRGCSLYALINEIFEAFLMAEESNINLRGVLEDYVAFKRARDAGFILELESLCYEMADIAYESARDKAVKSWFEAGVWFAKRYISGLGGAILWEDFKRDLKVVLWNTQELEVRMDGDRILLRVISPRFTSAYTIFLASFFEGCLSALGYKIDAREVFKGRILLEAVKTD
ncbi:MAG: hypothetical protein QXR62_05770 [Candidatus Bathyarchaeia archaeon]